MAKKITYAEPADYFPKEMVDKIFRGDKKTAKKTVKKSAGKTSKKK